MTENTRASMYRVVPGFLRAGLRWCMIALSITVIVSTAAFADIDPLTPWADCWNNLAFNTTNFESDNFSTHLDRFEGRFGVNLLPIAQNVWIKPYVGYVMVYSGNKNYYNNNLAYGGGVRINPFMNSDDPLMRDLKVYIETMQASWLQDETKAKTDNIPTTDTRWGYDLWHEWNQKQNYQTDEPIDYKQPWAELWSNLSFHSTNFNYGFDGGYIFNLQPKMGFYLNSDTPDLVEPYIRADLVMSSKTGVTWDYLNTADVGLGVRLEPFRKGDPNEVNPFLFKFKAFGEALVATYFTGQTPGRPDSNVRLGIDFTVGR